jgi:hypothetical protein
MGHVLLNGGMTERRIGKDVIGSDRRLLRIYLNKIRKTRKNSVKIAATGPRFEAPTTRILTTT